MNAKRIAGLLLLAACVFLAGCSVKLGGEKYPEKAEEIKAVIAADELPALEKFSGLKTADLRGSSCFEEISAWADEHPDVEVIWSVPMPDGQVLDSTATEADFSALTAENAEQALALTDFLPELRKISLGTENSGGAAIEIYDLFSEKLPGILIEYSFSAGGRTIPTGAKDVDFTCLKPDEVPHAVKVLSRLAELRSVELGKQGESELGFSDIAALQDAVPPEVDFSYEFSLYDLSFTLNDEVMDFYHVTMEDEGAAVREVLPCMRKLRTLDMDTCGVSDEAMAAIRDDFPDVKVIWRIWFGEKYSVRTDVTRILASKASVAGMLYTYNTQSLKYCTDVVYLDVGHSEGLADISFVSYMPDLEVCIVAMGDWCDASPLAACTKLEYLEMQTTKVSDVSPLAGLKNLRHLNLCYLYDLEDISPLYGLTELERLWIGCLTKVPKEQIEQMQLCAPGCVINTTTFDPTEGGWREIGYDNERDCFAYHPRYELLREQFGGYYDSVYAFYWNDPWYYHKPE